MKTIVINLKTYEESTGENAVKLANVCKEVSNNYNDTEIILCSQPTDLKSISSLGVKTFAQHIDPVESGKNTGHVTAFSVKASGVTGILINHSEKKLSHEDITKCIELANKYNLITIVCSDSMESTKEIAILNPDYIAYEDPVLIGTGESISKTKPEDVKEFVSTVSKINPKITPLCGAGISTAEDVKSAIELGTKGVLLASAFV